MRAHVFALVASALVLHGCPSPPPASPPPDAAAADDAGDRIAADSMVDLPETPPLDLAPEMDSAPGSAWDDPVPLTVVDGLPLFEGSVDGGPPMPFLFDTLAQIVFLDEDLVGDVLYHETPLVLGDDDLGTFQVKGRSMTPDEIFLGLDIAGLVGQAYIWKRFLVLDYPGGRFFQMQAPPDLDADPLPGWEGAPPWIIDVQLQNAFPVVRPSLGDGGPVALLADTSSPITTITQSVFDALDDGSLPRVAGYVWSSKYGSEAAFLTRLPTVRFGALEVTGLAAAVIPDDHHLVTILGPNGVDVVGWLGAGFWERFALGIDPEDGTEESPQLFYLWGDGAPPEGAEGRWDKVGLEPAWRDGGIVIEMVYAGSDAEAQGITAGDALLAVDGAAAGGVSLEALRERLRGAVGETRVLSVTHADGGAEDLTVLVEEILP
jgi:hypothetical protein